METDILCPCFKWKLIYIINRSLISNVLSFKSNIWNSFYFLPLIFIFSIQTEKMMTMNEIYQSKKTQRHRSVNVTMDELIDSLTKKYFFLWRNFRCKIFLAMEMREQFKTAGVKIYSDYQ